VALALPKGALSFLLKDTKKNYLQHVALPVASLQLTP